MAFQEATSLHDHQTGIELNVNAQGNVDQVRYWNLTTRDVAVTITLNDNKVKTFTQVIPAGTQLAVAPIPPNIGNTNKWTNVGFGMCDI